MKGSRLTTEEFIKRAKEVHGDKYDYSLVDYKNSKIKVKIICPKHGDFEQTPTSHLQNFGCKKCSMKIKGEKISKDHKKDSEYFIKKAKEIHGDKYDYSLVNYINNKTKVEIICPIHGSFWQVPHSHTNGQHGCPLCGKATKILTKEKNIEQFKKIHGDKYDYSKVEYEKWNKKIEIICPIHGSFWQTPGAHKNGEGCPKCNCSHGETKIKTWLLKENMKFEQQYKFEECCKILPLPFDFYLTEKNILIEFDGEQHFKPVKRFGGNSSFEEIKENDRIKNAFCKNKGLKLIRISYKDFQNIEKILKENIC